MNNLTIKELCKQAYENSRDHGFYDYNEDYKFNIGEKLMLIVSELGEALEADRYDNNCDLISFERFIEKNPEGFDIHFEELMKNGWEDEIADTFIRLFDLCGYLNIDIEKFIQYKMQYNKNRPYKHNKAY